MAAHCSTLAWRIPWTEEPGGLLSMGLHRVRHDWSDWACMHALKKEMTTHSSVLAWRIPGTEEPGGLPSMGSHRVGHDWSDLAAAAAAGIYPYNTLSLVVTYQKGGRRTTEKPDSVSGLLTPVYDCLWNNARGRNQDLIAFVPHHWLLTLSPCLI